MPISPDLFRKVLGHFATGVTVVTMRRPTGQPWGFTVNAFSSVSLTPPLILVCVDHRAESFQAMNESSHFAVNFLAQEQEEISSRFASKLPDRFSGVACSDGVHGSPLIAGCLGFIECKKVASHEHGDHSIIIGEVLEAEAGGGNPLLFYRGSYAKIEASLKTAKS